MAIMTYLQLTDADGNVEAGAFARDEDGKLLPPGTFRIRPKEGDEKTMTVEEMPEHWRHQIKGRGEFGRKL